MECEKKIVHLIRNYSVIGSEPRKNVLLTYYKLTFFVSHFPYFRGWCASVGWDGWRASVGGLGGMLAWGRGRRG